MQKVEPMKKIRVRSVEGRSVMMPGTGARILDGIAEVPDTAYYRRRIRCGDLALEAPPDVKRPKATKTAGKDEG